MVELEEKVWEKSLSLAESETAVERPGGIIGWKKEEINLEFIFVLQNTWKGVMMTKGKDYWIFYGNMNF